jgi:predicted ribosome quality control (RQC) complex YloA/Tae2 family protein
MLKYALVSALFLVGFAQADQHIEKSDVNKVYVMKDNSLIFELKDESYYKGDILTSDCLRGRIYFHEKEIHNTFRIENTSGFKTCRFSQLERIA